MDYAIVDIGGHQIWVEEGQYFAINKIEAEPGAAIDINRVLLINKDGNVHFGKPYVTNSKVKGEIMGHYRGSKILVYKILDSLSITIVNSTHSSDELINYDKEIRFSKKNGITEIN